jgi:hypothetical protein
MVWILPLDDALDLRLSLTVREGPLKADANAANAIFKEPFNGSEHVLSGRLRREPNDILFGHQFVDDRRRSFAVEAMLVTLTDQETDLGSSPFAKHVRGDRRGPANELYLVQKLADAGEAEVPRRFRQAFAERYGIIVWGGVDLESLQRLAVRDQRIRHGAAGVDVHSEHLLALPAFRRFVLGSRSAVSHRQM